MVLVYVCYSGINLKLRIVPRRGQLQDAFTGQVLILSPDLFWNVTQI